MGGLVARAYLAANSLQSQNVEKVITLGTPHKGSHIARRMQQKGFDVFLKNSVDFLLTENGDWPFNAKL